MFMRRRAKFPEVDLFRVPEGGTLDPDQPWRLQLLAQRAFGARDKAFLTFDLSYELPQGIPEAGARAGRGRPRQRRRRVRRGARAVRAADMAR